MKKCDKCKGFPFGFKLCKKCLKEWKFLNKHTKYNEKENK